MSFLSKLKEYFAELCDDLQIASGHIIEFVWEPLSVFGKCTVGIPFILIAFFVFFIIICFSILVDFTDWLFIKK